MSRILVVDDEKIISHSLQRVLGRAGHAVEVANNGLEAIQLLEKSAAGPDLMFLDFLMPEIGGGEVLDFAKRKFPGCVVLMMTAYGDTAARNDLLARGAAQVLAKPFDDITKIPDVVAAALAGKA